MIKKFYDMTKEIDVLLLSSNNLAEIEQLFYSPGIRKYFFYQILLQENIVSWLVPLNDSGFFNVNNHPKNEDYAPYIPYWDVLEFLKKVADFNETSSDPIITDEIISIINSIIEAADNLKNFRTDYYMAQIISTLPVEMIEVRHFNFLKIALDRDSDLVGSAIEERIIPKLLKNKSKENLLKLLKIILSFKIKKENMIGSNIENTYSVLGDYKLTEIFKKYKDDLIVLCDHEIINIIIEIMKELIIINSYAFNHIWIPTIENHSQTSFIDRYECQVVYFLRDSLESIDINATVDIVNDLLNEQHNVFQRLAIHIINSKYQDLNQIFWLRNWNPINEIFLKHEIYELFKSHSLDFTSEQIDVIIAWIEDADYFENDNELIEEQKIRFTAYTKKEWYSALLSTGNIKVTNKYQEYEKINPTLLDHPGFNSWTETGFGGPESPVTSKQINEMRIEELVNYLSNYKGDESWPNAVMTYHGLGQSLKQAVLSDPLKYIDQIFLNVPNNFQYNIISGFKEVIEKDKKTITNYNSLFNFLFKIIQKDEFRNYPEDQKVYSVEADIMRMTGWLLEDILRGDDIVFSDEELKQIEKLLFYLESITKSRTIEPYFNDSSDIISLALNSPKGIVYNDLVLYSLKYERIKKSDDKNKWKDSVKSLFDNLLKNQYSQTIEFYIILGEYFIQLYYLDSEWVQKNINLIFPGNDELWKASITGYLYRTNKVYKEIFELLKNSENYSRAIKCNLKAGSADEQLVRHILVSYINGWESFSDERSLINQLLDISGFQYYRTIAHFIWSSRDFFDNSEKQERIKVLWGKLLLKYNQVFNPESEESINDVNRESFSEFLDWLYIFDNIDEDLLRYIIQSIKNSKNIFRIRFLVKHLGKFVKTQPAEVGQIFIALFESGNFPTYQDDEVKELVVQLYDLNQKEYADLICNKYGEEGFYFLRDIYYLNNS